MERQYETVRNYRGKIIKGEFIELHPINEAFFEDIVNLRNLEKNRYYLNQDSVLTVEMQRKWYNLYCQRNNDIYWCICNRQGDFIGTIRIYDINFEDGSCNQGSIMIDPRVASEAPYAVELELITLDFIFNELKMKSVINEDRIDNKIMNSLSKKVGFQFIRTIMIRDIEYNYYLLNVKEYLKKRDKLEYIVTQWTQR